VGYQELIKALHEEGEEKIRAVRREAEEEAGRIREETSVKLHRIRDAHEKALSGMLNERTKDILLDAEREASASLLASDEAMSDRLYRISVQALPMLREGTCADVFDALAEELPAHRWQHIRVAPEDREAALKRFPDGEIVPDASIVGGLDATDGDGRVRVINTFEKRLANAWQETLPGLIRDVYERCKIQ
jgi:vacuolar-type H+-ATPase subunit E/Vma4